MTETEVTKKAVKKFWGTQPCGIIHSEKPTNSADFFAETEAHRYEIHTDGKRPFLLDAIGFSEHTGKLVVEVGCGIGVDSILWKRAGNRVISLDYNMPSCRVTRDRFRNEHQESRMLNGDAENLPFASGSIDLAYSFGVLHHTPATGKTIEELYRCLKPGGEAIVMLYYKWSAKVLGEILLGYGLRRGELWRTRSLGRLISECTEFDSQTKENICPLTKVYSKREIRKMFYQFRDVQIELHYLWMGHWGPLRHFIKLLPNKTQANLHRRFGWNAVIKAVK